jgi:hypothetical protein
MQRKAITESHNVQLLGNYDLIEQSIRQRQRTERFIHDIFNRFYAADIHHFLPNLLNLSNTNEQIVAALGFRPAENESLFLENYLSRPVEQILAGSYRRPVVRKDIVEVGNLAIAQRGAVRSLIVALTGFLFAARFRWCVFTIGQPLINSFQRMGIELQFLTMANNDFMSQTEKNSWGRYYDQKPQVMACSVDQAYQVLVGYILNQDNLINIWVNAQHAGRKIA